MTDAWSDHRSIQRRRRQDENAGARKGAKQKGGEACSVRQLKDTSQKIKMSAARGSDAAREYK